MDFENIPRCSGPTRVIYFFDADRYTTAYYDALRRARDRIIVVVTANEWTVRNDAFFLATIQRNRRRFFIVVVFVLFFFAFPCNIVTTFRPNVGLVKNSNLTH